MKIVMAIVIKIFNAPIWVLKIGIGEIGLNSCINEKGNLVPLDEGIFSAKAEDEIEEAMKRIKKMRFFICPHRSSGNKNLTINFDPFKRL